MFFKNSFLGRLFWDNVEDEETAEKEAEEAEKAKRETGSEQLQEEQAAEPERPPGHMLQLSQSHSFYKLWEICSAQMAGIPQPELCLEGDSDPLLPDEEAKRELLRLQMLVNSTANGRYEKLQTKKTTENGEPAPFPDLDAQVVVYVAQNALTAWLFVYPPVSQGKELDREMLAQALEKEHVSLGLNGGLISELPQHPARYFRLWPIAQGIPPVHGVDGRVMDLFPRVEERKLDVDESNRVDYTNLNFIHNVEKDGVICRIIPPTKGTPGRSVQDKAVEAKDGKPAPVPKGRNTELSKDETALLASIAGHVEFSGRSFQVKPVLDIPGNVDFSVGNINFFGDVRIRGDVCAGFTVRATGSITVDGVVEACSIEAGKDLVVARGVQGDNQAVIRAQRNVFAKYLENSCIYAKMDLETECIVNCEVYCGGKVTVKAGHRSIIGGSVHAGTEIHAGIIGSRAENRTEIFLGGQPCEDFDFDMLTKEIKELTEKMERTERQPDSPNKVTQIGKLRMQLAVNRGKLEMIRKEREQQAQETPDFSQCRMKGSTVYPGTVLSIGGVIHQFTDLTIPCAASLSGGEIRLI